MSPFTDTVPADRDSLRNIPLKDLLSDIADRMKLLASKEVELVKAEIKADVKSELAMARDLTIAAVCGLLGLNLLLIAAALALATLVPAWAAFLIVAAPFVVLAVIFGMVGWAKRGKTLLAASEASFKEDFEGMKNPLLRNRPVEVREDTWKARERRPELEALTPTRISMVLHQQSLSCGEILTQPETSCGYTSRNWT